jgi:DNA polymerase III alpha subunit
MKIKSVTHIKKDRTLDLEVNHPLHQFYCNGLLTSNSHSISYTYISFYEAWLKYHFMPEFYTALLNNTDAKKEKKGENLIAQYLTEAMKKGFRIHIPSVNKSDVEFTILGDKDSQERFDIIFGLAWIKGLASNTIKGIVDERNKNDKYKSIDDFFERMDAMKGRKINKKDIDALLWSGAFDCFLNEIYEDRFDLHEYIWETVKGDKKYIPIKKSDDTLIEKEYESINISMKEIATFAGIKKEWEEQRGVNIDSLIEPDENKGSYTCIGKVTKLENKVTKTGKDYVRINLRDETNELKMIYCWPWKCKKWDEVRQGQTIVAHLNHDDSGFKNLTGWSMLSERSEALIEAEQSEKEAKVVAQKESENKEKELEKEGKTKILDIVKMFKQKYTISVGVEEGLNGRPNASVEIDCGDMNTNIKMLVMYYTNRVGFSVRDLRAFRHGYDYVYIVRNSEEDDMSYYLYKTKDFKSNLLVAPKDDEGFRYPMLKESETVNEQILFNQIDNRVG